MDRQAVLKVAVSAARAAGAHMKAHSGRSHVLTTKADYKDLVTKTDKECQDMVLAHVREAFGETHEFLGEEDVPSGKEAASKAIADKVSSPLPLWVIDPIDGTTNFIAGLPLSCVSIGVAEGGVVNVAVIYDPFQNEMFTAVRGEGAFLNGEKIGVIKLVDMRQALFGWGLHHARNVSKTMLRAADTFIDNCRGLRSLGSAALMMAYVAAGRFAAFYEHELCAWDIAAGGLLVTEAGGLLTDMRGEPFSLLVRDPLVSCSPEIHADTLRLLKVAGAQHADPVAMWPECESK